MNQIRAKSITLLRQTVQEWMSDDALTMAAALSFYTVLSIAPLLVILLRVTAAFYEDVTVRQEIETQVHSLLGEEGKDAVIAMLSNAASEESWSWATFYSSIVLLVAASGVFAQFHYSLNRIWKVEPKPSSSWLTVLRDRVLAFLMVLATAILLMASLIASTALSFLQSQGFELSKDWWFLHSLANVVGTLIVFTALFAISFKALPNTKVAWRDVWMGAFLTAALFMIGKSALGVYLEYSSLASSYGAAGSLVVLLVWVYYSSLIVFFGAEFTQVTARMRRGELGGENVVLSD